MVLPVSPTSPAAFQIFVYNSGGSFVGSYSTLAAAVAASSAGGRIWMGSGSFSGDVTIDHQVTLQGANFGVDGTATRSAESYIIGQITVTAGVVIDGVEIVNTTDNTHPFVGVKIQNTSADVTIENSIFYSNGPNANTPAGSDDRAISMDTTASGHVTITGNVITGASTDDFSTANWARGIWSDGAASQLDISHNTFVHVRSAMNLDGFDNAKTSVTDNHFASGGTGIAFGIPTGSSFTAIHDNQFDAGVGEEFNFQNLSSAVSLDLGATNNTGPSVTVLGSQAGDSFGSSASNEIFVGNGGVDTVTYGGTLTSANFSLVSGYWQVTAPDWSAPLEVIHPQCWS